MLFKRKLLIFLNGVHEFEAGLKLSHGSKLKNKTNQ